MDRMIWRPSTNIWALLPEWWEIHGEAIRKAYSGDIPPPPEQVARDQDEVVSRGHAGTAVIPIHGPMMKHAGLLERLFFGVTSTSDIQAAILQATADPDVTGIMLHVESPGGHVSGIHELSETVRQASRQKKVFAHIDSLGASAAFWAIAHADRITAEPTAEIGSLGTMALVVDSDAAAAMQGVRMNVISSAPFKGVGMPGTRLSKDQAEDLERRVADTNAFFMSAVQTGRKLNNSQLNQVNDGRVFIAATAKDLGLIDDIMFFGQAIKEAGSALRANRPTRARQALANFKCTSSQTGELEKHA